MSLAEAQGLLGGTQRLPSDPIFARHDPQRADAALRELAIECQRFSPIAGIEPPDAVVLEVSGCVHLQGGEERLTERYQRWLRRRGYVARVALADTLGAAWACARFGTSPLTIVPAGRQAEMLAGLPVAALRLPIPLLETLDELGLRYIGQLLSLPRQSLPARFGPELLRRLDQAWGDRPEPIEPIPAPQPIEAAWDVEYPTGDRSLLAIVLERLVGQVVDELATTPAGILRLEIAFIDTAKQELRATVGLLRPSRSVPHLMSLVQMRLERLGLTAEVARVEVRVATAAPLQQREQRLFARELDAADERELAQLVERLSCHLGPDRVVRPVLRADPQPECVVRCRPLVGSVPDAVSVREAGREHGPIPPWLIRPLQLLPRPVPVNVLCSAGSVPDAVSVRDAGLRPVAIVRCWGPERIETGWWRGRHIRRDYYRIETETGRRYWLYRALGPGTWFLQGEFE
jgi:protein ImuB